MHKIYEMPQLALHLQNFHLQHPKSSSLAQSTGNNLANNVDNPMHILHPSAHIHSKNLQENKQRKRHRSRLRDHPPPDPSILQLRIENTGSGE